MNDLLTDLMEQPVYTPSESYGSVEEVSGFLNADPKINSIADVARWTWKARRIKQNEQRFLNLQAIFHTPDGRRLSFQGLFLPSYLYNARRLKTKRHIQAIVKEILLFWQNENPHWSGLSVAEKILMHHFNKSLKSGEPNDQP